MRKNIIKDVAFLNFSLFSLGTLVTASPLGFGHWLLQTNTGFIQIIAEALANLAFGALVFSIAFTSLLSLIALYKLLYHGKKEEGRGLIVTASLLINLTYTLIPSILIFSSSLYLLISLFVISLVFLGMGIYQRHHAMLVYKKNKITSIPEDDELLLTEDETAKKEKAKYAVVKIELSTFSTAAALQKELEKHQQATALDFSGQDLSTPKSKQKLVEAWENLTFPNLEYLDFSNTHLINDLHIDGTAHSPLIFGTKQKGVSFPKLQYLSLSNNNLSHNAILDLKQGMEHFQKIKFINMRHNQINEVYPNYSNHLRSDETLTKTLTIDVSGNPISSIEQPIKESVETEHNFTTDKTPTDSKALPPSSSFMDASEPSLTEQSTDTTSEAKGNPGHQDIQKMKPSQLELIDPPEQSIDSILESKEESSSQSVRFFAKPEVPRKNAFYPEVPILISPENWIVSVGCPEGRDHLIILLQSISTGHTSSDTYCLNNSVQSFEIHSVGLHVSKVPHCELEAYRTEYNFCHYAITDEQGKQLQKNIQEDYDRYYTKKNLGFGLILGLYPKLNLGRERYNCTTWAQKHLSNIGITLPDTWMPTWAAKNTDLFGNLFSNPTPGITTEAEKPCGPS